MLVTIAWVLAPGFGAAAGQPVKWSDVAVDAHNTAVKFRREMEAQFRVPRREASAESVPARGSELAA